MEGFLSQLTYLEKSQILELTKYSFHMYSTKMKIGIFQVQSLRIIVQSAKCAPKELDEHIEAFLTSFRKKLANISEEEFCKQRDSLIISCLKKPKSMIDETFRYVSEMESKTYIFDRKWKLASELDQLSLNDVVSFFDHFIAIGAAKRRKLSIRIVGKSNDVKKSQINENSYFYEFEHDPLLLIRFH